MKRIDQDGVQFGDFDPLKFPYADAATGQEHRAIAEQLLGQAARTFVDIGQQHRTIAEEHLSTAHSTWQTINDIVRGDILRFKVKSDKLWTKLANKVRTRITDLKDDAYFHLRRAVGNTLISANATLESGGVVNELMRNISTGPIDPASAGELFRTASSALAMMGEISAAPPTSSDAPPLPKCPDGTYATCPTYSDMVVVNGEWKCISTLDGSEQPFLCDVCTGPDCGGGGGGGNDYECIDNKCVQTPNGTMSLAECKAACVPPPPGPGDPGTCTDSDGNVIEFCTGGEYVTTYTCVNEDGTATTTFDCYAPCVINHICGGGSVVIIGCEGPDCPPPPPPPPTPPLANDICAHAVWPAADDTLVSKSYDSKMYYTLPPNPGVVIPLVGKLVCLKDGTAEFVCDGKSVWRGPAGQVGTAVGRDVMTWEISQEVNESGLVVWNYSTEEPVMEMRFDHAQEFYFLQFGHRSNVCVAPPPPPPPPEEEPEQMPAGEQEFCDLDYYKQLQKENEFINGFLQMTPEQLKKTLKGELTEEIDPEAEQPGFWAGVGKDISGALLALFVGTFALMGKALVTIAPMPKNCKNVASGIAQGYLSVLGFGGRWLGLVPESVTTYLQYIVNSNCQTKIPQSPDLNAMRLADRINKDQWTAAVKMNGDCVPWQEKAIESARPTPQFQQIYGLFRSDRIDKEWRDRLLKRAAIDTNDEMYFWETLSESLPGPSDLMRMMTRDVVDQEVVNSEKLDTDFDVKWADQIKEWGQRQNITDDTAKMYWRAHWDYPSTGQVFETLHRLRPDANATTPDGQRVEVTLDDARRLLKINDLAPEWVDRMIATSYAIIPARQLKLAWSSGVIDEDGLISGFQDAGYTKADAIKQSKAAITQSRDQRAKFGGWLSPTELSAMYRSSAIDATTYESQLLQQGLSQEFAGAVIESDDNRVMAADVKAKQAGLRKSYLRGDKDDQEYIAALEQIGIDHERAVQINNRDSFVKNTTRKEISLEKLCKMVARGLIDVPEYIRRAKNLGFNEQDSTLQAMFCITTIQEQQAAKVEKALRDANALSDKIEKKKKTAIKDAKAEYLANLPCRPKTKPPCGADQTNQNTSA